MFTNTKYRDVVERIVREQAQPSHKYGHQPRLYALCRQIGASTPYDDDVVYAAVWLHDLGVFEGNRPASTHELVTWDHVAFACEATARLLATTDFPRTKIAAVLRVIEEHQPHQEPTSIESTIVRDADILEQLGAIGVLRTAAKLGSDTRFHLFSDVQRYLERQLATLPEKLRLEASRRLAVEKINSLSPFLSALRAEAVPELY